MKILVLILLISFELKSYEATSNEYVDMDPYSEVMKSMTKDYMDEYQANLLSPAFLVGGVQDVIRAKKKDCSYVIKETTEHDFDGISIPTTDFRNANATVYVFSMLLKIRYNSALYDDEIPFFQAISTQIVCVNDTQTERSCEVDQYKVLNRRNGKGSLSNTVIKTIKEALIKTNRYDEPFVTTRYEYQDITRNGGGRLEYVRFVPKSIADQSESYYRSCIAVVYHEKENQESTRIFYLNSQCYKSNYLPAPQNELGKSNSSGGHALIIALLSIISAALFVGFLIKRNRESEYAKIPIYIPWERISVFKSKPVKSTSIEAPQSSLAIQSEEEKPIYNTCTFGV